MKEINLTLSVNELNLILEALGNESYVKVFSLIEKIHSQAKPQVNGSVNQRTDNGTLENQNVSETSLVN